MGLMVVNGEFICKMKSIIDPAIDQWLAYCE